MILFTYLVFGFTSQLFTTCRYLILFHHLINFHARFRYYAIAAVAASVNALNTIFSTMACRYSRVDPTL